MRMFRKLSVLVCVLVLCLSLTPVHAITNSAKMTGAINIACEDQNTVVSEAMTADQMIELMSANLNISHEEAQRRVLGEGASQYDARSERAIRYRTITTKLDDVAAYYKPSLEFYCQTDEATSVWAIVKILNVELNRNSQEPNFPKSSKQFSGNIYTNLETCYIIYYSINGDFYNNGTTSANVGVNIGVGEYATINFSVSGSSNHFVYYKKSDRIQVQY